MSGGGVNITEYFTTEEITTIGKAGLKIYENPTNEQLIEYAQLVLEALEKPVEPQKQKSIVL